MKACCVTSLSVWALCLMSLLMTSSMEGSLAFFNNNNNNNNKRSRPRRRLMEEVAVDDAATGTVKPSKEELEAEEAGKTCDGQLAQTLVAANEAKQAVEEELSTVIAAKDAADQEVTQLQASVAHLKEQLSVATSGHADVVGILENDYKTKTAALEKEYAEKLESLQAEYTEKISTYEAEAADTVPRVQLEAVQTKLETQAKEFELLLEANEEKANKALEAKVASLKTDMQKAASEAKAALDKKDKEIEKIAAKNKELLKAQTDLKAAVKESDEELEHWRSTFSNRTYCNVTHISDDIYESSVLAYNQAAAATNVAAAKTAEAATKAATQLNYHGTKLAKELSVQADVGYKKGKKIYEDQYNQHWPKVKPHYDEHVLPVVKKFNEWKAKEVDPHLETLKKEYQAFKTKQIDPRMRTLNKERKALFAKMVEMYAENCKVGYQHGAAMAKENELVESIFKKMGPGMKESCQKPELSVTLILRVTLVLVLLPFTGRILGLIWGLIRFVWNIFLTVTLIRFILPKPSPKPVQDMPDEVESNSKVSVKKRAGRV